MFALLISQAIIIYILKLPIGSFRGGNGFITRPNNNNIVKVPDPRTVCSKTDTVTVLSVMRQARSEVRAEFPFIFPRDVS